LKPFTQEETREIVFKLMLDAEIHHTVQLDGSGPADYRSVVAFFARQLLKELRLVGGYDVLYGKVKAMTSMGRATANLLAGWPEFLAAQSNKQVKVVFEFRQTGTQSRDAAAHDRIAALRARSDYATRTP